MAIVKEAGEVAKQGFGNSPVEEYKEHHDFVTRADRKVEDYVLAKLLEAYPGHGYVSEERGNRCENADCVWILDPIDGTKHYAQGIPLYSISLALQEYKELVLGVVFNPETSQMFCGTTRGKKKAELNGTSIQYSNVKRLSEAIVCAEIPSSDSPMTERRWAMRKMSQLVDHVRRVRILGVSALSLCYCANGSYDAYVNLGSSTRLWDRAAGEVILKAAGGEFHRFGQKIVAGPPVLCGQLLDLLGLTAADETPQPIAHDG